MKKFLLIGLLACCALGVAEAQTAGTIELTPQITSADGSVTPILTWKTTPAAQGCTATGDWTGAKAAAGTETLPTSTKSQTFNLECVWADAKVTVRWTPPTLNTDGSAYTDAKGYRVAYGNAPTALSTVVDIDTPATTSHVIENLASGTWYFGAVAVNLRNVASEMSAVVSKVVGTASGTTSVGIVVNPVPAAMVVTVE